MRVVSDNSEGDLARKRAEQEVSWALRSLTTNLIRVARGAGRSYEIGQQAVDLINALTAYREAFGHYPPAFDLDEMLSIERDPELVDRMTDDHLERYYAEQSIIRGSLQQAASRLIGQGTQESAGRGEMYDGLREIGAIRERERKKWADEAVERARKSAKAKTRTGKARKTKQKS